MGLPSFVHGGTRARILRAAGDGALVGGLFGALTALNSLGALSSQLVVTQAKFVAVTIYGTGALAALVALASYGIGALGWRFGWSAKGGRGIWCGWSALAFLLGLETYFAVEELAAWSIALLVLCVFALALLGLHALGRRVPMLESTAAWAGVLLALLASALVRIAASPPFAHGAGFGAIALWIPALLLPVLLMFVASRSRVAWAIAALAVTFFTGIGITWMRGGERAGAGGPEASPNLLLITVDTLRADHLGCYGSAQANTPNIDNLAQQSHLFENAISPYPSTNPAHASLLCGLYPGNHGIINNAPNAFFPGVSTLPELLAERGMRSAAFVSGYTLKRNLSRLFERFQLYDDVFGFLKHMPSEWRRTSGPMLAKRLAPLLGLRLRRLDERFDRTAENLVDEALDWLGRNGDEPFFLWLHFYDPHMPYDPPAMYRVMHGDEEESGHGQNWYLFDPEVREKALSEPQTLERFRRLYRGEISYVDAQIGRLLEAMKEQGLWEETTLVLTSDHGESLGEHDYYFDHSYFLYGTCLKVPLLVRLAGAQQEAARHADPVRLVDLFPTLLEHMQLDPVEKSDGRSLMPLLDGSAASLEVAPAISVTFDFRITHKKRLLSVRTDRYKYVRTSYRWDEFFHEPEREELYDLQADPGETVDLSAELPSVVEELRELSASQWMYWTHDIGQLDEDLSDEERAQLEALGYL